MKKDYTYEEYIKLDPHIQLWARRISVSDGREFHPEDYVDYAKRLINKAKKKDRTDYIEELRLFSMIISLYSNKDCHCDGCYSFLDWFEYVIGR